MTSITFGEKDEQIQIVTQRQHYLEWYPPENTSSHASEDTPVGSENAVITSEQFSRHAHQLAGVIEERNVFHPSNANAVPV